MKTKRLVFGLAVLSVVAVVMGFRHDRARAEQKSSPRGEAKAKLDRKFDFVEVRGDLLGLFEGVPIRRLSLFAFQDGDFSPIPFQVDKRDREGKFIMTGGKAAPRGVVSDRLAVNDELVFMAADAGDRFPEAEVFEGRDRIEIEITDPRYPDRHAWAYLIRFDRDAPRSETDYISYDPRSDRITTPCCIIGYQNPSGFMFYNELIYKEEAGGSGEDLLDRIKFRVKADFFGDRVTLERNEEMITSEVRGWIDGPVRVIRSTTNHVRVFENFPSMKLDSMNVYYPHQMSTSLFIRIPFNPIYARRFLGVRSFRVQVMGDYARSMIGAKAYTNLDPSGYTFTGQTPKEILDKIPKRGLTWGFATKQGVGTWFPRAVFPDLLYRDTYLYMADDITVPNPPESIPGEMANGLVLEMMDGPDEVLAMLGEQTFQLRFDTYLARPGLSVKEAQKWLDILDYPLFVDVHGGEPKEPREKKRVAARPPWRTGTDGVITDRRGRKICLKWMAYFTGSIETTPADFFTGQKIEDESIHMIPLANIRSIENYYVDLEPKTKTRNAPFAKVTLKNNEILDLFSCRICGWAGVNQDGMVTYLNNAQVERIEFQECEF